MKKRLLITSIVMMLVVAVALSTATYAWFTSNANVTASSISLTAGVNEADALGIGWAGGEAGTSIIANISDTLQPMAPSTLEDGTTLAGATSGNIAFFTQTTKQEDSVYVFNGVGGTATPVTFSNGTASAFYVKNLSTANSVDTITVSAVFNGDVKTYAITSDTALDGSKTYFTKSGNIYTAVTEPNVANIGTYYEETTTASTALTSETNGNDMIRVAIFKKANSTGASSTDGYTLLGVLGQTATVYSEATSISAFDKNTTYYTEAEGVYTQVAANAAFDGTKTYYTAANTAVFGSIAANGAVKDLSHHKVDTSLTLTTNLAHGDQVDIVAIIWLDGTALDDTRQGDIGNVSLLFSAS